MKKAISVLVAVAAMAFATSALATVEGTTTDSRNTSSAFPTAVSSMPSFQVGDTITITVTGLASGNELTVLSYKDGAAEKSDSTIQYIDQYTLGATTKDITYKIRNKGAGLYHLQLNDGVNPVDFYYTIGTVTTEMIKRANAASNADAYEAQMFDGTWSVGFVAKVTAESGIAGYVTPGFAISETSVGEGNYYLSNSPERAEYYEVAGTATYYYGVTMYKIEVGHQASIEAEAIWR